MDKYQKYMHTGFCNKSTPLPSRRFLFDRTLASCDVNISFDQFKNCMEHNLFKNLPYLVHFHIYDEAIVQTREECMLRYQFLKYLNQIPNATYHFCLSDSSLPAYISFMNSMDWHHENQTTMEMRIDRNPISTKKIPLEKARGKIKISEEKLLWYSDSTLRLLPGKVDSRIINDTFKLKRFIQDFKNKLDTKYRTSLLSDFDKAYITYHYLFDKPYALNIALAPLNISFASEQTYNDAQGVQRLKPSETRWESKPAGTLEHNRGVCTGQARLFNSVISSPEIRIPAECIEGSIPSGEYHDWSHFIINNRMFQCCTTMRGIFANLDAAGYQPKDNQIYTDLYPHAYLPPTEIQKVKTRVDCLKK